MVFTLIMLQNFEHSMVLNFDSIYTVLYKIWFIFGSWSFQAGFFNTIYNKLFLIIFQSAYWHINKYLDKGLFEYFGPFGIYKSIRFLHLRLNFSNYSIIFFSISFMFIGVILYVWYWVLIISLIYVYLIKIIGILPIILLNFLYNKNIYNYEQNENIKLNE